MDRCELCNELGTVWDISQDVSAEEHSRTVKVYCDKHAHQLGLLPQPINLVQAGLDNLRRLISFMKENQRLPTQEELGTMGAVRAPASSASSSNPNLAAQIAFLEHMVHFVERNERWPKPDELPPDPF